MFAPQFDFERILNDFVLLTCLAGNDFLPNIPSLDIYDRPSALDTLVVRCPLPAASVTVPPRHLLVHEGTSPLLSTLRRSSGQSRP